MTGRPAALDVAAARLAALGRALHLVGSLVAVAGFILLVSTLALGAPR